MNTLIGLQHQQETIHASNYNNTGDTTYTAGSGLSLVGTEFSNSAPDQTVSLTGAAAQQQFREHILTLLLQVLIRIQQLILREQSFQQQTTLMTWVVLLRNMQIFTVIQ